MILKKEELLDGEFLVRCYEDNHLCYNAGEVYVAEIVPGDGFYADRFLKVWEHGSKINKQGIREGKYQDFFISPLQLGNRFGIGNFERIWN